MREANVAVDDSALATMGIEELVDLGREAEIRDFEELACHGTGAVVQVTTASRYDEARLEALEYVNRWEHVTETDDGHLYVIAFTAPALPDDLADRAGDLVGTCDPELGERSATMSFVGSHETIAGTIAGFEAAGVTADLRKLGAYEGRRHLLDGLTDRQREVLRTAFELGYYEVPREVSTVEIGDELGLDPSTVSEHLQRAERNILSQLL